MSLKLDIQKKPNTTDSRQIKRPEDIYNLEEVQEIKDAIQEHFLFIGLDRGNHIRKISLMGIGTSAGIYIDSKQLIRNAIINAFDKVVFVHNHPSNSLEPSYEDKHLTDITGKLMEVFNIELVDHLIVTEDNFASMKQLGVINRNYSNENLNFMNKAFLIEENNNLKQELETLKNSNVEELEDEEEEI
ncbi:MAG: JAB domain-containing protein [Clostridia bacterium]|nr:JAB domain-containing protein [Clostridia bacterium]